MITRFALFAASLAAALVLAAGAVLVTAPPAPAADVMVDAAAQTTPAPVIQVDTVYVTPEPAVPAAPAATPEPVAPATAAPVAVNGGEHEGNENEGDDD